MVAEVLISKVVNSFKIVLTIVKLPQILRQVCGYFVLNFGIVEYIVKHPREY